MPNKGIDQPQVQPMRVVRGEASESRARLHPTENSLSESVRSEVCSFLQSRVAEGIDLAYQVKHAHWNVRGPSFISLHKLFDDVYTTVQASIDLVAERLVQLGGFVEGTIQSSVRGSQLPEYPLSFISQEEHVVHVSRALGRYGEQLRICIEKCDELEDAVTSDILTGIARDLDEHLWMVESHKPVGFSRAGG